MALLSPRFFAPLLAMAMAAPAVTAGQHESAPAIKLLVDESQAARQIAFVREEIPVKPGALSLAYPKWIPGEHGPTGPIENLAALSIRAGSRTLPWMRDPEDIFSFHTQIPSGTQQITVEFDTLLENTISNHQLLLRWNTVVLYPLGIDKRVLMIEPSVLLPSDWKQGSSLAVSEQSGNRVNFAATSLERLIDSPVLAGEFFRALPLASAWPAEVDITGESQAAIDRANDAHAVELLAKLVDEDQAMFGFRHWDKLHLLVSQAPGRFFDGLEHEDSPWNGMGDADLSKRDQLQKFGWPLLAHEQAHSWCGKYRRPAELYRKPDYQGPERTTLLWVYEGLTEYAGMLLATRAGFNDGDYMRDYLAKVAAGFAAEAGRRSSALVDTATDNWVLRTPDSGWASLRRNQDYYNEGALMWLYADAIIREKSQGRRSLDDFMRGFLGQRDTGPVVAPYMREDVEAALSATLTYDWHSFIEKYVYQVNPNPPTDGLEAAGWRLVYNDTPNGQFFFSDFTPVEYWGTFSVGVNVGRDGAIADVVAGSPAYNAGLGPHMMIVAVDGRAYSSEVLNEAIAHPPDGKISLLVRNFDTLQTFEIQYAGGVRYPHLERIPDKPDYLSEIFAPRSNK